LHPDKDIRRLDLKAGGKRQACGVADHEKIPMKEQGISQQQLNRMKLKSKNGL
jgi:hypothetical protein